MSLGCKLECLERKPSRLTDPTQSTASSPFTALGQSTDVSSRITIAEALLDQQPAHSRH